MPLNQQFTLAPGDAALIDDTGLRVRFVRVVNDSRCPADAICLQGQAGDAIVEVQVFDGGIPRGYELHTDDTARSTAVHGEVRLTLLQLQPYPFASMPTRPEDYRATLEATRR